MDSFEKIKIYTLSSGSEVPMIVGGLELEISGYTYTSERMAGPRLSAEIYSPECLDGLWTGDEHLRIVEGGEEIELWLSGEPSSRKDNTDSRYIHSVEFVGYPERILGGVYFRDAVRDDASSVDKYQSGWYDIQFHGTLVEFVSRFNDVLSFRGIEGLSVRIDEGVKETESKTFSSSDITLFAALQEAYKLWEVPFYFLGSEIVFGEGDTIPDVVFGYGADRELLSIGKSAQDSRIVTYSAGYGGAENIPYYYPNPTPMGTLKASYNGSEEVVEIKDQLKLYDAVGANGELEYKGGIPYDKSQSFLIGNNPKVTSDVGSAMVEKILVASGWKYAFTAESRFSYEGGYKGKIGVNFSYEATYRGSENSLKANLPNGGFALKTPKEVEKDGFEFVIDKVGLSFRDGTSSDTTLTYIAVPFTTIYEDYEDGGESVVWRAPRRVKGVSVDLSVMTRFEGLTAADMILSVGGHFQTHVRWNEDNGKEAMFDMAFVGMSAVFAAGGWVVDGRSVGLTLDEVGLLISQEPQIGDKIVVERVAYIRPSGKLMPSIYRESLGAQTGYPAKNDTYLLPEGEGYYHFDNLYDENRPQESVQEFEVVPSIEHLKDASGNALNVVKDVYFDTGYNTIDTVPSENGENRVLTFSEFYMKIGPLGFNLFDCALEGEEATILMLDGDCGACRFRILVTERGKNDVQVDENGDLVIGSDGKVKLNASSPQDRQNDTTSGEVWLRLALDDATYGGGEFGVMPSYNAVTGVGQKPEAGDKIDFVGIRYPEELLRAAERELDAQIVKFMADNNAEKFAFNITFSSIYLAQNPSVRDMLSSRSALRLSYDDVELASPLYVQTYTRKVSAGEALPEITVALGEIIEMPTSGLTKRIAAEVGSIIKTVQGVPGSVNTEAGDQRYLRKDKEDSAESLTHFKKGLTVGEYIPGSGGRGGAIIPAADGDVLMEVDYLNVRKKATFSEVVIDRLKSVGGRLLLSLASMECRSVGYDEENNGYKCYFEATNDSGVSISNEFVVGDLAICQSFANNGSHYYWREVVAVGADYIVLSNVEGGYDEGSDAPEGGDTIVQLGHVSDASRQNAIILSAYGEESPSIVQYAGVDSFNLVGKEITKLSPKENILTGLVKMTAGSSGLEMFEEWASKQHLIDEAHTAATEAKWQLDIFSDDGYISAPEKTALRQELISLSSEYESTLKQSEEYGVDSSSYSNAWAVYKKELEAHTVNDPANIPISEGFKASQEAFYAERTSLMTAIAESAKSYVDNISDNLEIGKYNLIRNSGFTGDYISKELDKDSTLNGSSSMFSDPLEHWSAKNAEVIESKESASGYSCVIEKGSISQDLVQPIIKGENYILSFKARGKKLSYRVAGKSKTITLEESPKRYVERFESTSVASTFEIFDAEATICEVQLERGTIVSSWGPSMWDNTKEAARYQSLRYLQSAIKDGSTEILGGLIFSNMMLLGNPSKKDNTAGISGIYNEDEDVVFWGGGSYAQAIETVMKYVENPTYTPTESELSNMAKVVITHGGKAILNDVIVRGSVYAKDGRFGILNIGVDERGNSLLEGYMDRDGAEFHSLKLSPELIQMIAGYFGDNGEEVPREEVIINPYWYSDAYDLNAPVTIKARSGRGAIDIKSGHIKGLRRSLNVESEDVNGGARIELSELTVVTSSSGIYIVLPDDVEKGAVYEIWNTKLGNVVLVTNDDSHIYETGVGDSGESISWTTSGSIPKKIDLCYDGSMWHVCTIK